MASEQDWRDLRSRLARSAAHSRSALKRCGSAHFARLPRPARQGLRLVGHTVHEALEDRVPGLAAEAALFTLISLPALLLAVIGSLGFVAAELGPAGTEELRHLVLGVPRSFLSDPTFSSYERVVQTVLAETHGNVVSLGIVLSIWSGSRAVNSYLQTMTIAYDIEPRPGWRRRLLALALTLGFLVSAVAVLPPMVLGPRLLRWLSSGAVEDATLRIVDLFFWPGVILVVFVGLTTVYNVGVPWRTPWRRDAPGALLAMTMWLVASAGLRIYLTISVRQDAVFSQLAVPIAVILWIYVTAFAVLLGAEFNAEIERMWPHEEHPWRLTPRLSRRTAES
ncbi:putative membrane protein [Mycolicibacterium chubuense NBB4]|uniref:Putative membrane protein n=1 Tax=Mycolicibacterium chubuense (strain NBB4) TaxID=710421 RepID=I4BNJ8_MYCCN|nr:YihY/virulence factor BrkB family protein [Mycolicibacterium chubuense]AFM18855.1 putative membrane protein [Mycolicibacterium chubuense NBB4]